MKARCRWPGCKCGVHPKMWACNIHWSKIPEDIRRLIAGAYKPVDVVLGKLSPDYVAAVKKFSDWHEKEE